MPAEIAMRHRPPHFTHVFSGGYYAAAYYSYMWSEMLDADAFAAFEETGDIFDPATAQKLKEFVLSAGGSRDPAELYVAFRGRLPSADALLEAARLPRRCREHGRDLHTAGHRPRRRRRAACAARARGRPRDARRRRQRHRGDDRDGGDHRRGLSAHEPHRRRRLLAGARAERPRARASRRAGRPAPRRRARSIAITMRSRRAGRWRRSPCRARSAAGCWRCEAAKAVGGRLPLDVLLDAAIRHAREGYVVTRSQAALTHGKTRRD